MLIVEDDLELLRALVNDARRWTESIHPQPSQVVVRTATSLDEARTELKVGVDLVLLDVRLGRGSGVVLVRESRDLLPATAFVAMSGEASADEAFELARLGVRGYIAKPFSLLELRQTLRDVLGAPPDLEAHAAAQVGHRPIHTVQDRVRLTMLKQALAQTGGNITRTAQLLGVQRQAVQQMIARFELAGWVQQFRPAGDSKGGSAA